MYFPNIFVEHSYAGIRAVSILLGLCGSSTALADRYESFDDGMTPLNWSELASPVAAAGEYVVRKRSRSPQN